MYYTYSTNGSYSLRPTLFCSDLGMMTCRKVMTIHRQTHLGWRDCTLKYRYLLMYSLHIGVRTSQNIPLYCPYGFPHSAIQTIKHGIRNPKIHPRDDEHYLAKQEIGIPTKVPLFFTFGFTSTAQRNKNCYKLLLQQVHVANAHISS